MTDEEHVAYDLYPLDKDGNLIDEDTQVGKEDHERSIIVLCVVLIVVAAVAITGKLIGLF